MAKKPRIPPIDRVFCGLQATCVVWADRCCEVAGDYRTVARLFYDTLELVFYDCPPELKPEITSAAEFYPSRRGQQYQVSGCGQTVLLGSAIKEPA